MDVEVYSYWDYSESVLVNGPLLSIRNHFIKIDQDSSMGKSSHPPYFVRCEHSFMPEFPPKQCYLQNDWIWAMDVQFNTMVWCKYTFVKNVKLNTGLDNFSF